MRRIFITALGCAVVCALVAPTRAATISLSLEAGYGTWKAYASADSCDGIASFIIDVRGISGDVAVTSSQMKAPKGYDAGRGAMFGFASFVDGTSGIGIYAGQPTMYSGGNDSEKDALVLLDVGISAGSHLGVSWDEPVLLAQGDYTGTSGTLKAEVGDGFFNVLDEPWQGPGHVSIATLVTPGTAEIPEPATLGLVAAGACLLLARGRGRRST